MLNLLFYCILYFAYKLTSPESKKHFSEIDDFTYEVIYKKELVPNTPSKLMSNWRSGFNILTIRIDTNKLLVTTGMLQKPKRNLDSLQIEHIAVDPGHQHQHLGALVVATLVDYAKDFGANRVKLKSLPESV